MLSSIPRTVLVALALWAVAGGAVAGEIRNPKDVREH
jgi:hypothetical protein